MHVVSPQPILCYSGRWPELKRSYLPAPLPETAYAGPSIGVVIPAHNSVGTILETISSILANIGPDDEVFVVENGSSDSTWPLLVKNFSAHPSVHLIQSNEANAAIARSKGVEIARKHPYVAFCDADDLWTPDKISMVRQIIKSESPDIIFHPMLSIAPGRFTLEGSGFLDKKLPRTSQFCWDLAASGNFLPTSAVIVRRDLFPDPAFFAELRHTQDFEAWCAMSHGNKDLRVTYIDQILGIHRWMGGLSKSVPERLRNVWQITKSYIADAPLRLRIAALSRNFLHICWWLFRTGNLPAAHFVFSGSTDFVAQRKEVALEIARASLITHES